MNCNDANHTLPVGLAVDGSRDQMTGSGTYLDTEQEKVEVEVETAEDIFVGDSHQDAAPAVGQDGDNRVVGRRSRRD